MVKTSLGDTMPSDHCCARDWSIQEGYLTLAHQFEEEFMEDMRLLGVARPDVDARVRVRR